MKKTKQPTQRAYKALRRRFERAEGQTKLLMENYNKQRHAAKGVIAEHIASQRSLNARIAEMRDKMISDSFKITELENQVAVQQKMVAEARADGERAIAQHNRAVERIDELLHELQVARNECDIVRDERNAARDERNAAQRRIAYRIYDSWLRYTRRVRSWWCQCRHKLVERATARLLIMRLNMARVDAVTEAGYVPGKLVKAAIRYWEHDKERLQEDEQLVMRSDRSSYTVYRRKPGLWRRIKIILGRA